MSNLTLIKVSVNCKDGVPKHPVVELWIKDKPDDERMRGWKLTPTSLTNSEGHCNFIITNDSITLSAESEENESAGQVFIEDTMISAYWETNDTDNEVYVDDDGLSWLNIIIHTK